jgi:death-on-curing protein
VNEPVWINLRDALAIHERLLALYGGPEGLRDQGLLESALARPKQLLAYGDNPDLTDLSAALTAGIVWNHPFVDGNKRTGFLLGVLFLELNGVNFVAKEEDATLAVRSLASKTLDEAEYRSWLSSNIGTSVPSAKKRAGHKHQVAGRKTANH